MIVIYTPDNCRPPSNSAVIFSNIAAQSYVNLSPGANTLEDSDLEALKAHPDLQTYLGWGAIELVEPTDKTEAIENPDSLLPYSLAEQKKIIAYCVDPELLTKWRDDTANQKLKSFIQTRIAAVNEGR
jgi:hypothetical protein